MTRAAKTDNNQAEIVAALRKMGAFVFSLHVVGRGCPDLLVAYQGSWYLAEVKNGKRLGWRLTPDQRKFRAACNGTIAILDSVEAAISWINTLRGII